MGFWVVSLSDELGVVGISGELCVVGFLVGNVASTESSESLELEEPGDEDFSRLLFWIMAECGEPCLLDFSKRARLEAESVGG